MSCGAPEGGEMETEGVSRGEDGTVIGVEAAGAPDEDMKMVVGSIEPSEPGSVGESCLSRPACLRLALYLVPCRLRPPRRTCGMWP